MPVTVSRRGVVPVEIAQAVAETRRQQFAVLLQQRQQARRNEIARQMDEYAQRLPGLCLPHQKSSSFKRSGESLRAR